MMDEYNSGMDPEVKKYFRKIINSASVVIFWLLSISTLGLFFDLGIIHEGIRWYNILFYSIFLISMAGIVYYLVRVWRKKTPDQTPGP
jgi:hypothetical protein